jgi:hypothetical protein
MLGRLIILGAIVVGLLWFLHWFRGTPPQKVAKVLRKSLLYGGIALVILLVVTGRLNPVFAAIAAAVPVILRGINLLRMLPAIQQVLRMLGVQGIPGVASGANSGTAGRTSSIRTRFLEMTLDHDSGDMDGLALEGEYRGRRLSDLGLEQLLDLLATCRSQDAQSAAVLEAYLDRTHGETWRGEAEGEGARVEPGESGMTREEALAILGLHDGASPEEIRDAHRRLMQKLHPDRGGSDYLAAKINQAKRILIGD